MAGKKPIKSFKAGAVKASIFENTTEYNGQQSVIHRVVIDRTYKDSSGNWKSTSSFSVHNELPKAILVLQKAFEYLTLNEATANDGDTLVEEEIEG